MLKTGSLGLMIRRNHSEKIDDDRSRLVIVFDGEMNCSKGQLIDVLESNPEIHEVENISMNGNSSSKPMDLTASEPVAETYDNASSDVKTEFNAHDQITPQSLKVAEGMLLNLLGPVAPMLIQAAADETKNVGDLFYKLAEDLDGEEKMKFLSVVGGLDLSSL